MSRAVGFWVAVLLVFAGGMLLYITRNSFRQTPSGTHTVAVSDATAPTGPPLTEFELTDQTGARFHSKDLDGKVWAGSFFFASCPSTCYNQNVRLQQLLDKYGEQGLVLVSITCDPGNDTPSALTQYAARFNADVSNWKFLTSTDGSMDYLKRIGQDFFGIAIAEEAHTDRLVIFGPDGQQRGAFSVLDAEQLKQAKATLDELLSQDSAEEPTPNEAASS